MSAKFVLPQPILFSSSLSTLFGLQCTVDGLASADHCAKGFSAIYCNNENQVVAALVADVAFSAFAGSALCLIPPGQAKESAKAGTVSEMMLENLYEVMNILSRLLMTDATPHLRLTELKATSALSESAKQLIGAPAAKAFFKVDIERYGEGRVNAYIS